MYAVIRRYSDVPHLINELQRKHEEASKVMGDAPGFVAYYAMRNGDELTTITVCQDRESAEETSRRAGKWVSENVTAQRVRPPEATGGEVFIHVSG